MTRNDETHDTSATSEAAPAAPPAAPEPVAPMRALRGMTQQEMIDFLAEGGFPAFRAKQLFHWVFRRNAESLDEMTNLPKAMRQWLAERAWLGGVFFRKAEGPSDKTRKVLFGLSDGKVIESVVMRDEGKERTSLCVSSQVGCAVGCTFCLTGFGGFQRQLTADEIVGQVLAVRRHLLLPDEQLHGMVFMGMGEPMLNLDAVIKAIKIISDPDGIAMSARRITVSTSGVIPGIEAFGRAATGANLAVSLNATTDKLRTEIMPLNKRWPIKELTASLRDFPLKPRQRITVEYVLLKGVNDKLEDAQRIADLLKGIACKINLIMFNPHELLDFEPVPEKTLDMFLKVLTEANYTASVRWSKGREIEAACGQLAAHYFQKQTA